MKNFSKVLSLVLALVMVLSCVGTAFAADTESVSFTKIDNDAVQADLSDRVADTEEDAPLYSSTDIVRVSIVLDAKSTVEAGYSTSAIADNAEAMAYRASLKEAQKEMEQTISKKVLGGKTLDVAWNLTLAANIISANVAYGKIEQIKALDGVKDVVVETQYAPDVVSTGAADPNMSTSAEMVGSTAAYLEGYTGAGSRIAIIDTGTDSDHQSFDAGAFEYSLQQLADEAGVDYETYVASLGLLDIAEITAVFEDLNIAAIMDGSGLTATDLYGNTKLPFGFNYVDLNVNTTHDYDTQGSHGSHVAGIAAANAYVSVGDGYEKALDTVLVQGVAPDAQIITMKVFGANGGAYDSDYMAAIEDAILLGCDSVNLSLGSGSPGSSKNETYQELLDNLSNTDTVVVMSAGNSGSWADSVVNGVPYLYADDISLATNGSPGSYTNSLAVASVENIGLTGTFLEVGGTKLTYSETEYNNVSITTLDTSEDGSGTELDYIFFVGNYGADGDGNSTLADYADAIAGKIAFVSRGTSSFFQKHEAAAAAGAAACVVYNNQAGVINMDLTDSTATIPCVSITLDDAYVVLGNSTPVADDAGNVLYYTGKLTVAAKLAAAVVSDDYVMSSFSSWGVPGSLELKPEITAPGGNIYSINGVDPSGTAYEVMSGTSMAAPQVTGMVALVAQYIKANDLTAGTDLTVRALAQSLLMSTAEPILESESGSWYSIQKQGAGAANVGNAVTAESYILVEGQDDGKVKVELYDDPDRTGAYTATFSINNLTEEAVTYNLSADFFTQGIFAYDGALYMDTWTAAMETVVDWTVDGAEVSSLEDLSAYDFDADGDTDEDDAQALMDYITGVLAEIANADCADVDGNGAVETADVYELLKLVSTAVVTVPASGSVSVTASIALTDAEKEWLDTYYTSGAYVEGFLFVTPDATEEGVAGTNHSIPVFGFYGNWSDASMYDVGSLVEYWYGTEWRYPYLPDSDGYPEMFTNYMTIKYAGDSSEYFYFGNPLTDDDEYLPERNGFNNVNGDTLYKYYFAAIRNAGNAKYMITDAETGEVYMDAELGAVSSAYYYVNGQTWRNTQYGLTMGWKGTDAEGNALPEGTTVNISLVLAPEYYDNGDGTYDWDALGEGAYLTTMTTIDNTAPEITDVFRSLTSKELIISAKDNEYISVIAIYDETGTEALDYYAPNQTDANTEETVRFDLSDIEDERLIVTVYDYAMNVSTYKLIFSEDESSAVTESITLNPTALEVYMGNTANITATVEPWIVTDPLVWTSSDETVATVSPKGVVTGVSKGECVITATSVLNPEISATCDVTVLTVDYTLNGALQDENGNPMTFTWNLAEDKTWSKVADIDSSVGMAAAASDGDIYVMDSSSLATSKIDFETGETVAQGAAAAIPYWDVATSTVFTNSGADLVNGIYGYYFLPMQDPLALGTSAYNLGSTISDYTGATYLVAVESAGLYYDSEDECYAELIYALDDAGYIWVFEFTQNGSFYLFNFYATDLALDFGVYGDFMQCSMVMADDGSALFLSHFDGETNNFYKLAPVIDGDSLAGFTAQMVGTVGEEVWPAPLTSVTANVETPVEGQSILTDVVVNAALRGEELMKVEASQIAATVAEGGLNAVSVDVVKAEKPEDPETATVTVTADDVMNNGLYEITYDAEKVELVSTESNMDVCSFNAEEGKVTFGFANLAAVNADDVVATLTFRSVEPKANSTVTVSMPETDAEAVTVDVTFVCDHVWGEWVVTVPATMATTGSETHVCTLCGESETREIPVIDSADGGNCYYDDFTDCTAAWYHDAVDFVVSNKLMAGISETEFAPNGTLTRAMMVTILYRAAGSPDVAEPSTFTDVPVDQWYSDAIAWAQDNGIVAGITETTFAPNNAVTREQIASILWRYVGKPEAEADLSSFSDADQISGYAQAAMQWANAEGIFVGDAGKLSPKDNATRAQFARIIMVFLDGSYDCEKLAD